MGAGEDSDDSALTNSEVNVAAAVMPAARKVRRFMVCFLCLETCRRSPSLGNAMIFDSLDLAVMLGCIRVRHHLPFWSITQFRVTRDDALDRALSAPTQRSASRFVEPLCRVPLDRDAASTKARTNSLFSSLCQRATMVHGGRAGT